MFKRGKNMKRVIFALLAIAMLACVLCACEPTPDQVKADEAVTLDTLNWSIAVEGGSMDTYTLADAQKHDLAKMMSSMILRQDGDANIKESMKTFIIQGVSLKDFLADIGKSDATEITYSGKTTHEEDESYTVKLAEIDPSNVIIGWIMNKKNVLSDSVTYVGFFFDSNSTNSNCIALEKISVK